MNFTVIVKEPVCEFARRVAPWPRRAVKLALISLRREQGEMRALEHTLTGCYRLRIGKFQLIFRYADAKTIEAVFLEERGIAHKVFEAQLP